MFGKECYRQIVLQQNGLNTRDSY